MIATELWYKESSDFQLQALRESIKRNPKDFSLWRRYRLLVSRQGKRIMFLRLWHEIYPDKVERWKNLLSFYGYGEDSVPQRALREYEKLDAIPYESVEDHTLSWDRDWET